MVDDEELKTKYASRVFYLNQNVNLTNSIHLFYPIQNRKRLSFNHSRMLKLDDDVLCVRISPNSRLIAVALLDSTVKVFFMDTLKVTLFYLLNFIIQMMNKSNLFQSCS